MFPSILILLSLITFHAIAYNPFFSDSEKVSPEKWNKAYWTCILNYCITNIIGYYFYIPTTERFYMSDLLYFIPHIIISDSVFYWTHRLFHTKLLYPLHKQHHEWHQPVSVSFLDSHPLEHLLVNVPTVIIPLIILPVSDFQQALWIISATINSVTGHMYSLDSKQPHVLHHKYFKYNYGAGGCHLMDRIMGTYKTD